MKKLLLLFFSFVACISSFAQLNGTGFYRVYNVGDSRYIYVADNTGTVNLGSATADLGAVQLKKGTDKTISSPETILYFNQISGENYDFEAQGTSVKALIGYVPRVHYESRVDAYRVSAEVSGATVYLGADDDPYFKDKEVSYLTTGAKGNATLWKIVPVSAEGDNYFGITPSLEVEGKFYQPFYASFAFSFYSSGMKAYYVKEAQCNGAHLVPIEEDVVPACTPVIIECSSANPSDNRLNVLHQGGTKIKDNQLKGVYFNNPSRIKSKDAVTKFDKANMRVLGKTPDGKLGFVLSEEENLASNQAYLSVKADVDVIVYAMDDQQYASVELPSIENKDQEIYSVLGIKLNSSIEELPSGIYIIGGKKVIKR